MSWRKCERFHVGRVISHQHISNQTPRGWPAQIHYDRAVSHHMSVADIFTVSSQLNIYNLTEFRPDVFITSRQIKSLSDRKTDDNRPEVCPNRPFFW